MEAIAMGPTSMEYRMTLISRIKKAYRTIVAMEEKLSRPNATTEKKKEWEFQLHQSQRELQLAFKELPEVRLSQVNMTAVEFAKELVEKKPNPKFLKNQTEAFLDEPH